MGEQYVGPNEVECKMIERVARPVFHEVEQPPGSARGDGGFGSTGGHASAQALA